MTRLYVLSMTLAVGPAHSFYGVKAPIKHIITRYTDFHVVDEWATSPHNKHLTNKKNIRTIWKIYCCLMVTVIPEFLNKI